MKKSILTTVFFLATLFAMAQTQFEQGMNKAFELWKTGNTTEASAMFERIASVEKNNWLPNYYIALVNTTTAFQVLNEKQKVTALLGFLANSMSRDA